MKEEGRKEGRKERKKESGEPDMVFTELLSTLDRKGLLF
jgi:hypothetical protein